MPTSDPKHDPFADPTFAHVPLTAAPTAFAAPPRGPSAGLIALGAGALLVGGAGLFGGGVLTGALLSRPARPDTPWVPAASLAPPVPPQTATLTVVPVAPTPPAVLPPQVAVDRPRIEVVFALDTTGSMGGLLKAAKQKVWSVVDQLSGQLVLDPASGALVRPRIALGLVAYRDRGDEYVTRSVPLTEDIDAFRTELAALRAAGGGDEPEAVGDAVRAAVDPSMGWSPAGTPGRARVLLVLGDAPGKDGAMLPWTVEAFAPQERGIHVDAVLCGADPAARAWFESLVRSSPGGTVLQVDQRPVTVAVTTPHDEAIARVQRRIEATVVAYGDGRAQERTLAQWSANPSLDAESYATRASAQCKTGRTYDGDLLQALDDGRVKLEEVTAAQVSRPDLVLERGCLTRARVDALRAERAAARAELATLVEARDAWLRANPTDASSLDQQLLRALRGHLVQAGLIRDGC